jgi:hypothetical protein
VGFDELGPRERERYTHLCVDLTVENERSEAITEIRARLKQRGSTLASVVLVNGTGFLDSELEGRPDLAERMEALNLTAPLHLLEGLIDCFEANAPILYYSGLLAHPNTQVPCVARHGDVKRRAADALRARWPERLKLVMPGTYRTEMVLGNIGRDTAMLEWFAVPLSNPLARGGLSDHVAKHALQPHRDVPDSLIYPRLTRLLVTKNTPEQLQRSLPGALQRAVRSVLAETGQTDAQHDARVRLLKEQQLYGAEFPYDDILSTRLWPTWASRLYAGSLRAVRMVD